MEKAIEALRNGGIILYPSDTVWALGCNATDTVACEKLAQIKGNSADEGMVLLADGFPMVERYIPEFQEVCYDLVDLAVKPLTIVYANAEGLAPAVLAKDQSVGFRITSDPHCLKLIRSIRKPLVATSIQREDGGIVGKFEEIPKAIIEAVDAVVSERQNNKMKGLSQIIRMGLGFEVKVLRK